MYAGSMLVSWASIDALSPLGISILQTIYTRNDFKHAPD